MAATVRQLSFIDGLLNDIDASPEHREQVWAIARDPQANPSRGGEISQLIDGLKELKQRVRTRRTAGKTPMVNPLVARDIPIAKYAIPASMLPATMDGLVGTNDHLFVEVKEFTPEGGTPVRYIKKLEGAPGRFSRIRVPAAVKHELARILEGHALEYTQLFGELYSCCGACGAELTDITSRRLKLGPDCRQRFGL